MFICEGVRSFYFSISGFQKMMQQFGPDDNLLQSPRELTPSSPANEKVDNIVVLTHAYHNYKRKYVKHLSFNPEKENLSKDNSISKKVKSVVFSFETGACPIGGSVYLL